MEYESPARFHQYVHELLSKNLFSIIFEPWTKQSFGLGEQAKSIE